MLNKRISRVFEVPDGAADSFLSTHATAQAAQQAGATILVYHEVIELTSTGGEGDRRVTGARVRNMATGEELYIGADMVINACGAWAGMVAAQAGVDVKVIPGKGVMLAMNHRFVNTVINRCKMPADGDIIVPIHTVAVIGTTDEKVTDPELLRIEPWEVSLMLEEGEKLVPGFAHARVLRAWAGVRPLYQEGYAGASRDATRALTLLDHRQRDGVAGFLTITGGKWTTFRLMAETTMDKVCEQLGTRRPCTTHETTVPGVEQGHYWLGHRLHEVEEHRLQGTLVCECELVTRAMIEHAAQANPTLTLDDLRRDVRLGMGPCQGGFCTLRAAGILHEMAATGRGTVDSAVVPGAAQTDTVWDVAYLQSPGHVAMEAALQNGEAVAREAEGAPRSPAGTPGATPLATPNLLLRDFLQARWRGLTPILWGQQLKQERLDELIYLSLLNTDHLPVDDERSPLSDFWAFDTTPK
jgi:glycerol-3-phosphate dehydrogenase